MMRMQSGIVCALATTLALFAACADSGTEDDGQGSGSGSSQNECGDAVCAASEVGYCAADCGSGGNQQQYTCGDAQCETSKGESAAVCFSDCGGSGSGTGSGSGSGSSTTCPADPLECVLCMVDMAFCMGGLDQATCTACIGGGGGGGGGDLFCEGGAPDGTCNAAAQPPEDATTCPSDCP